VKDMSFGQIKELALFYGLNTEQAEDFAMSMYLQGITSKELVISALRIKITKK
jgi:hypothetical protein